MVKVVCLTIIHLWSILSTMCIKIRLFPPSQLAFLRPSSSLVSCCSTAVANLANSIFVPLSYFLFPINSPKTLNIGSARSVPPFGSRALHSPIPRKATGNCWRPTSDCAAWTARPCRSERWSRWPENGGRTAGVGNKFVLLAWNKCYGKSFLYSHFLSLY